MENNIAEEIVLLKTQTGIAAEFYAAGELCRLGYNVTFTFGNTKSIDLIVEKNGKLISVQVKGIQKTKSICWNLDKTKIQNGIVYILVNLHVNDRNAKPEFFVLTAEEARIMFTDSKKEQEKRTYLDYKKLKKLAVYENRWNVFD